MALKNRSMFLYGFQVSENNRSIDFRSVSGEAIRLATLRLGYYSLSSLGKEIERALHAADQTRTFSVTIDRTYAGGFENRVTITSSSGFFQILGSSGPRSASSALSLIGFNGVDYSGATTYTGQFTAGTTLIPRRAAYNYKSPKHKKEVFGNVNVSASGVKEAVVYSIQTFWQGEFKYEFESVVETEWDPFINWIIQQRLIEFTPDIAQPELVYEGTLDRTEADSKGLGHEMLEMTTQNLPGLFRTGLLTFRVKK
jgi:hypothetical protein